MRRCTHTRVDSDPLQHMALSSFTAVAIFHSVTLWQRDRETSACRNQIRLQIFLLFWSYFRGYFYESFQDFEIDGWLEAPLSLAEMNKLSRVCLLSKARLPAWKECGAPRVCPVTHFHFACRSTSLPGHHTSVTTHSAAATCQICTARCWEDTWQHSSVVSVSSCRDECCWLPYKSWKSRYQ